MECCHFIKYDNPAVNERLVLNTATLTSTSSTVTIITETLQRTI